MGRGSISAWCKDVMRGPFSVYPLSHNMLAGPLKVALVLKAESLSERGVGLITHVR